MKSTFMSFLPSNRAPLPRADDMPASWIQNPRRLALIEASSPRSTGRLAPLIQRAPTSDDIPATTIVLPIGIRVLPSLAQSHSSRVDCRIALGALASDCGADAAPGSERNQMRADQRQAQRALVLEPAPEFCARAFGRPPERRATASFARRALFF
jgi:hypothetical protein